MLESWQRPFSDLCRLFDSLTQKLSVNTQSAPPEGGDCFLKGVRFGRMRGGQLPLRASTYLSTKT